MRAEWSRATPILNLNSNELTALIAPAFPGQYVQHCVPTEGGLANANIGVHLSKDFELVLVRLYLRDPGAIRKEVALNRLVTRHIPVPRFLYWADDNPVTGHPYVIMEWADGERLETAIPTLSLDHTRNLGHSIGATLAGIHAFTFAQTGFLDGDLNIVQPISLDSAGLATFLTTCLIEGKGKERIGTELTHRLLDYVKRVGGLLDTWEGPPCLTHSDFGGSNILVGARDGAWKVTAVLDWEFAFSGSPFFDLGNLLRSPLGERTGFEQAVHEGYTGAGGVLPERWRQMSRLADLTAWAEFMNRPVVNEALIRDATAAFLRTIEA